jgi:hypothetical protein
MKKFPKTPFNYVKKLVSFAPTILGGGILLLASVPPSLAAPPPSCVRLAQWREDIPWAPDKSVARATNNCTRTQRFRMIWTNAYDGLCRSIPAGHWIQESRQVPLVTPYVSRLEQC